MSYTYRSTNKRSTSSNAKKPWSPKPEVECKQKSAYNYNGDSSAYKNAPNVRAGKTGKNFMNAMAKTWDDTYNFANLTRTENGAWGYKSTGNKLVDLNFAVASLRGKTDKEIYTRFRDAFNENPVYAMRWLAYASDVREGLGERNLFRVCMIDLAKNGQHNLVKQIVPMIPEYSRWDNLWPLLNTKAKNSVLALIKKQMKSDNANYLANKSVSLMAKWLPSENASSKESYKYANIIMSYLKMNPKQYRQWLARMRKYIDVVERKMSSQNWQAIDYEAVPSRANLIYNKAFLKHDYERRNAYLSALTKGEAKINSSVAYPHDIVARYNWRYSQTDPTLEGMWKALPDMVKGCGNTLVVADGSGSMGINVGGTKSVTARNVADALAIYFAERCSGQFNNNYITFSETPQLVNLGNGNLASKLKIAHQHNEVANTNIEAVFNLILQTALNNDMTQEDLPQNILIISDMEFDGCVTMGKPKKKSSYGWYSNYTPVNKTLFGQMAQRYEEHGFKLPRLIFWNVNSRTGTIPVKENDMGVALVSGFSVNICKMVMSGKTDPLSVLLEAINVPRYDAVEKAVVKVMEEQIGD